MYARILLILFLQVRVFSIQIYNFVEAPNVISEQKEELTPLLVSCGLNDIVIISAPIINNHTDYYLTSPNGDTIKLDILPSYCENSSRHGPISSIKYLKDVQVVTFVNNHRIFNLNDGVSAFNEIDIFREKEESLEGNEFMIGPLDERDHGNWVLSAYYQRQDTKWIEVFQVISIEILEIVAPNLEKPQLTTGEDLNLSFKDPIDNLQSCELIPSASTVDRFYTRSTDKMQYCNFFIPNVTKDDVGIWRIIGVGNIVFETTTYLSVIDKVTELLAY